MVQAVAYSNFRKDLKSYMRKVNEDSDMLLVTNTNPDDDVVVMSAADYDSMMETLRVYQNPYLRNKITHGLEQVRQGQVQEHALLDGDGSGASA
ncbi:MULTISPECIES: type II toxin-antitoxin system Phd/YefM family antitoxin [Bifidobacterium]|jgi:antitoxin YefM|uniref:Antitoxin n=1 Tax=Bifidobacterium tibiigranuli TaxID=2172043 RepID=A0A5N6S603_9BIFI|nr:type II toxin-antitoxin system Phd/YefM family antitoxin [Bifidobacterium tibiigranuli]KAE8128380.1 type II toxin-antitoxin system Phd/YefM family antitoxin [Bifidobacterium tibiigranuli]KAE8128604.1 type II toxin-antitoxin system prevent-host-death family antitoxin [Bifidobacterium tibiigranuli]MCH3974902.1 type II toxin-antitoxin system Phd/YefM family antitoxin [Bifidobacterium tibiigranuli]MCH4190011.1 type II toxin-antitoxin system Phd/YefM family antitoxin [Bifidobacterium tibiigranuli